MKKLIDWFRLSKTEYCEKYGHKWHTEKLSYYENGGFMSVAERVTYEQERCSRCGKKKQKKEVDRYGIQSLSMSSDRMRKLEKEGKIRA